MWNLLHPYNIIPESLFLHPPHRMSLVASGYFY
jgi:hypothetical protein